MELLGVFTGPQAVADHSVLANTDQAASLADATALGNVVQHGDGLVLGEPGIEEGRALAFGEAGLAGLAVEQAALVAAVVAADGEVAVVTATVVGAVAVLAAEALQVVHDEVRTPGAKQGGRSLEVVVEKGPRTFNGVWTPPESDVGKNKRGQRELLKNKRKEKQEKQREKNKGVRLEWR